MKMSDMRAKARAIFGPAIAEPMPRQPNGAKALQERANARPIPTYKVGGAVKKGMPPQPTAAEREAERKRREEYAKMKVSKEQGAAITRGNRAAATERPGYKKGGKVQTSADTAKKLATEMGGMKKGGKAKKDGLAVMIAIGSPMKGMKRPVKKAVGGTPTAAATAANPKATFKSPSEIKAASEAKYANLTKRIETNKATRIANLGKSVLGKQILAQEQRLSVDRAKGIAPPAKKYTPEQVAAVKARIADNRATRASLKPSAQRMAEATAGTPVKKAQGGAGKVRKGMMTPEGKIVDAMNKMRSK